MIKIFMIIGVIAGGPQNMEFVQVPAPLIQNSDRVATSFSSYDDCVNIATIMRDGIFVALNGVDYYINPTPDKDIQIPVTFCLEGDLLMDYLKVDEARADINALMMEQARDAYARY